MQHAKPNLLQQGGERNAARRRKACTFVSADTEQIPVPPDVGAGRERCCPPGMVAVTSTNEQWIARGSWDDKHTLAIVP